MTDTIGSHVPTEFSRAAGVTGLSARLPLRLVGPAVSVADFVLLVGASVASGVVYHRLVLDEIGDIGTFFGVACAVFFYLSLFLAYRGSYSVNSLSRFFLQTREITLAWIVVFLMLVTVAFLLKVGPNLSRGATIVFFVAGWAELLGWRWWVSARIQQAEARQAFARQPVIVLSDRRPDDVADHLAKLAAHGYSVARFFVVPATSGEKSKFFDEVVEAYRADPAVAALFLLIDWSKAERIDHVAAALRAVPLPVRLLPDRNVARFFGRQVVSVGPGWATEIQRAPLTIEERVAKRILDVVVSTGLLVLFSPLMLMSAILIKLDSRGPVFFVQTRTGFNARPFRIFKFRTLTALEDGPVVTQVSRGDRRVTRVGRALRRTSIDELPQLINILKGEMSLVGPRPHAKAHTDHYEQLIANYAFRHHVKPGLSGWAQVNGYRGETTLDLMKDRVEHDLWYIDNWSLWLDVKILLRTCVIVLRSSAY